MPNAAVQFIIVTHTNVVELSELKVRDEEDHLIAPNPEWIAEVAYANEALTYGMYSGDQPVGLLSLVDPRLVEDDEDREHFQTGCLYVWRVMVDRCHRGKGYGKAAIDFACRYAQLVGLEGVSLTTMDRERGSALAFHQAMGFVATGRRLDNEIELVRRFARPTKPETIQTEE